MLEILNLDLILKKPCSFWSVIPWAVLLPCCDLEQLYIEFTETIQYIQIMCVRLISMRVCVLAYRFGCVLYDLNLYQYK